VTVGTLTLCPGARLLYYGDVVEVVEIDGPRVTLRSDRTRQFSTVLISRLVAHARSAASGQRAAGEAGSLGVALGGLTGEQRAVLADRAGHVREVLTGYRAGHADAAAPGEPRPEYDTTRPLKARYRARRGG